MPDTNNNLTVITTHVNADFDALGAMLAAQKLYPHAKVIFPGSQDRNLRNFFITSMVYLFNIADLKSIDFKDISRLVLVDTRQPRRIGPFASLLSRADLDIHIYDHHGAQPSDIHGTLEVIEPVGASVSLLADLIRQRQIDISPDEATIMCLGIYEDTGSFTFSSTTEKDFSAAAFLLSKGANLNTIANMITREINPLQVGLLNDMIQAAMYYHINGYQVLITSIATENYVADLALLVHKLIKMEAQDAYFSIAQMEGKIYVIARSKVPEIDVGAILSHLHGGGHAYAASATIRNKTLAQVEQQLLQVLRTEIRPAHRAQDLMSAPAITVDINCTCQEAAKILTRYNINALLVTDDMSPHTTQGSLAGYITRQIIEKALYHKLENVHVREYMSTELAFVPPEAEIAEIQHKIIENKQRILPVIRTGNIIGVITRTDLFNVLVRRSASALKPSADPAYEPFPSRTRNIVHFIRERLSASVVDRLRDIGQTADVIGYSVFVVGGFVRDLYLYRKNEDIDIVVEGNGIEFAKAYARKVGGRIHPYAKFGTAVIIFPDGSKIDVASARLEYYTAPAALPTVEMSSIKLDLFRRDFSINTLAIQLNHKRFGLLIDFFSAQRDIKDKFIRVLHNLSFVEDPTRVFRAIRFSRRFDFSIGKLTANLIRNAVEMDFITHLSGRRLFGELRLILEEEQPVSIIQGLHEYDLLKTIDPELDLTPKIIRLLNSAKKVISWYDLLFIEEPYMKWAVYLLALQNGCDHAAALRICQRLELAPRYQRFFLQDRFQADATLAWLEKQMPVENSVIYNKLNGFQIELILYIMAAARTKSIKRATSFFITRLRYMQPQINGQDLIDMGLKPGPVFGRVFNRVRDAKMNGEISSHQEELDYARAWLTSTRQKHLA